MDKPQAKGDVKETGFGCIMSGSLLLDPERATYTALNYSGHSQQMSIAALLVQAGFARAQGLSGLEPLLLREYVQMSEGWSASGIPLAQALPADIYDALAARLGVLAGSTPRLLLIPRADVFSGCLFASDMQATLYVTSALLDCVTPQVLEALLVHELAHILRLDPVRMLLVAQIAMLALARLEQSAPTKDTQEPVRLRILERAAALGRSDEYYADAAAARYVSRTAIAQGLKLVHAHQRTIPTDLYSSTHYPTLSQRLRRLNLLHLPSTQT